MAHTLNKTQLVDLFHVLEVPYADTYYILNGLMSSLPHTQGTPNTYSAKSKIVAYLDGIHDEDDELETVLKTKLDDVHPLLTDSMKIRDGAIGDISGVTKYTQDDVALMKDGIIKIVPFYREHERMEANNNSDGRNIRMIR